MEAIFLAKDDEKIKTVYRDEMVRKYLHYLLPMKVVTKETVQSHKEEYLDTRFIFSTWYMPGFSEDEVKKLFPSLEAVFYAAGTVKYFAEPFLNAGIKVFSAVRANGIPVAEFTVSQIILANKGYFQAQLAYKKPTYRVAYSKAHSYINAKPGNYRTTIGLIGAGAVGRKVIELLKPYHVKICVYDPYVSDETLKKLCVERCSLEDMFADCDVISNHLPDTEETKGILNYGLFSRMKDAVTFINTGRGAQVVEADLIKAMKQRPLACALLDVTSHEPLFPWSPLYRMKNIFITPHMAGSSSTEEERMAEYMFEAYSDYIDGKSNSCEVTKEMLTTMA